MDQTVHQDDEEIRHCCKQDTPISEQKADDLLVRSVVQTSIESLTHLEKSLLFAELSMISYLSEKEVECIVDQLNFNDVHFHDRDGAQAYSFISDTDHVIACRGTEPNQWNDIKADLNALTVIAETIGRVHRGFKQEVDDLWPLLELALADNSKKLWFTGHSLGGAMAVICAGRCLLSHINSNPRQIYTYGSPRVGNKRYISHVSLDYFRWVNNNDLVTRVPPLWLGYRHCGKEMYLDAHGKLKQLTPLQRGKDRTKGFLKGLRDGEIDYFSDHRIDRYIDFIYQELIESSTRLSMVSGKCSSTMDE